MSGFKHNRLSLSRYFLLAPCIGAVLGLLLYFTGAAGYLLSEMEGGSRQEKQIILLVSVLLALLMILAAMHSARKVTATLDAQMEAWQLRLDRTRAELQENQDRYLALINLNPTAMIAIDEKQNIVLFNRAAERVFGYHSDDIIGHPLTTLMPERYRGNHPHHVNHFRFSDSDYVQAMKRDPVVARKENGEEIIIEASISRLNLADETLMTVSVTDITARQKAEQALRENESKFRSFFESAVVAIVVANQEGDIVEWNSGAEAIFGYTPDAIIGKPMTVLLPEYLRKRHSAGFRHAIANGGIVHSGITHELIAMRANQQEFHMQMTLSSWQSGDQLYFSAMILDTTQRKEAEELLQHHELFDSLTSLPNRVLSLDRLTQLINKAHRKNQLVAAVLLDLDDFKKVNDTLGHEIGDKVLVEAAERLQGMVRSEDTVGRLGGDEFIILVSGINHPGEVHPIIESLLRVFNDPFSISDRELILTASMGIAIYPDDGINPSKLLRNADSAMYHSKETGRNTYSYFTDTMNQQVLRRFLLEEQMHGALERSEFRVVYQPLVSIGNETMVGVEALLRWNNKALGEITPDEFIPVAEHTGMIISLGKFVVKEALRKTAVWQTHLPSFRMAINLSPRQFRDPDLVGFIERSLQQASVTPATLELEITEGVLMSGQSYIEEALVNLRGLGVGISMDDFGTGYSSLSYLRRYPFDTLKIDRSFIKDLTSDTADRELINAIIAMARSLGLKTVAEGVEERDQLEHLAEQGCEYAQGYLFSRPVDPDAITAMLQTD
jgi:diguanylate cyclase (GGDEF)-like protein/PAS domain S-box-containing protein